MSDLSGADDMDNPSGPRRGLMPALVVSLVINLAFVGLFAGHYIFRPGHGHGVDFAIDRILHSMPKEARAPVRAVLEAHRPQVAAKIAELRKARHDVRAALTADPFDRAKLDAAFAEVQSASMAMQADLHTVVADAVSKLDPEARHKLNEWGRDRDHR